MKKLKARQPSRKTEPAEGLLAEVSSQKCDTLPWTFQVYVSESGACDVDKRISKLSDEALEEFRARVRYLANTPKLDWCRPAAAKLKGVDEIYEIRFKANGLQHRPLGVFGPGAGIFTVVLWSTKKGSVTDPGNAITTASERVKTFKSGATVRQLKIDGEVFPPLTEEQEDEGVVRQSRAGEWSGEPDSDFAEKSRLESS